MKNIFRGMRVRLRNQRLRTHPLSLEIDPRVDAGGVFSRSVVSNNRNYCYFRLPKCANSTVVNTLATYDPDVSLSVADPKAHAAKRAFGRLQTADVDSLDDLQSRYFLFTFVRNPYTRLLSSYLDKVLQKDPRQFVPKKMTGKRVSFEEFVNYLEQGGLYSNMHWAPQHAILPVRAERLDFYGRVETLDQDLEYIVDRLFGEGRFKGVKNREVGRKGASSAVEEYYTPDLMSRVKALYQKDFELFAYGKPG